MTDIVPADEIEDIVGATREPIAHLGRAVSEEQTLYILHSQECLDSGIDLRECKYSKALDRGIDLDIWDGREDTTVFLVVDVEGMLEPL